MGVIANKLKELMPKYNYLRKLESEINTQELMKSLAGFVYDIFYELRPLSHKFRVVRTVPLKRYSYIYTVRLGVGTWFRVASSWQKYGSDADGEEVFNIVRDYGNEVVNYLRKPIQKDFSQLVALAKQLKPYNELRVSHTITRRIVHDYAYSYFEGKMILKKYEIDRIQVLTSHPRCVYLLPVSRKEENIEVNLHDESNVTLLEDVIDDLIALYKDAKEQIDAIKRHNERIQREMSEVVLPWKLSKELK